MLPNAEVVSSPDIPKLHDVPIIPSGWVCMTVARLRGEMYVTSKSESDERAEVSTEV